MEVVDGGRMTIGGTELRITDLECHGPSFEQVDCRKPDERWTFTDAAGHLHRWWVSAEESGGADDPQMQLPTLVASVRYVECDGSCPEDDPCEGYPVREWWCLGCGAQVEPGFRPGTQNIETSGGYWSVITVEQAPEGDLSRPSGVVQRATIDYPSGPGQTMHMAGEVAEVSRTVERYAGLSTELVREFEFRETA